MTPSRILLPLSWLYGAVVIVRNMLFDIGVARAAKIAVPVISVGNISTGGTGKTPFVAQLVEVLQKLGRKPAILSRGYGRKSHGFQVVSNGRQRCAEAISAGDEPALLAEKLSGVSVVVDEKRARGARQALELFSPDVIVLDDAFQHRSLFRDCDVVLMTADEVMNPSLLLPAGYRREPLRSLKRANLIVISKCRDLDQFREAAGNLRGQFRAPVIGLCTVVAGIYRSGSNVDVGLQILKGKKTIAFSGIADASSFDRTLNGLGVKVLAHHRYEDHHWYTLGELHGIAESFRLHEAEAIVTTEKDMVRIAGMSDVLGQFPLFSVAIRSEIIAGEEELRVTLEGILRGKGK